MTKISFLPVLRPERKPYIDMNVKELEIRVVDLKLRERDLVERRSRLRGKLLYNAEKHPLVNRVIEEFFVRNLGIPSADVERYSQQGKCGGRGGEEHLAEVIIILSAAATDKTPHAGEISVRMSISGGFEDEEVSLEEQRLMDQIEGIRREWKDLNERRKGLKKQQRADSP